MSVRAWCDGCAKYVVLTGEGLCPEGHPRPALRNLDEIPDVVQAPSADSPQLAAVTSANAADPGTVYPFDAKIPVVIGLLAVAGIALVYVLSQRVESLGLGGLLAAASVCFLVWIAVCTATRPYVVTDSHGLALWRPNGLLIARTRRIEWHQVATGRREGHTVHLELDQGGSVLLYLANLRPHVRKQLLRELAQRLGTRWAHPAGEVESINWGASRLRVLLPLVLLLAALLCFFYLLRVHPDWIQRLPL